MKTVERLGGSHQNGYDEGGDECGRNAAHHALNEQTPEGNAMGKKLLLTDTDDTPSNCV